MYIEQIMTPAPLCCEPSDTLDRVAHLMWNGDCGCLPVCADDGSGRVIDIITDRDICMAALFRDEPLSALRVADVTPHTPRLRTCRATDSVADVERLMQEAQVRRLPVLDDAGTLIGMVSLADFAREAVRERRKKKPAISESDVGTTLGAICQPPTQPQPEAMAAV